MKGSEGEVRWLRIRGLVCTNESCHSMHCELPDMLAPHKHFEIDIIAVVLDELIMPDTKGFEDHPSEETVHQWHHWFRLNRDTMEGTLRSKGYQLLGFTEKLLTTSISLLSRLREDTCDWLRIVLRFIYKFRCAPAAHLEPVVMHRLSLYCQFVSVYDCPIGGNRYEDYCRENGFSGLKPMNRESRRTQPLPENFDELVSEAIQLKREVPS